MISRPHSRSTGCFRFSSALAAALACIVQLAASSSVFAKSTIAHRTTQSAQSESELALSAEQIGYLKANLERHS